MTADVILTDAFRIVSDRIDFSPFVNAIYAARGKLKTSHDWFRWSSERACGANDPVERMVRLENAANWLKHMRESVDEAELALAQAMEHAKRGEI